MKVITVIMHSTRVLCFALLSVMISCATIEGEGSKIQSKAETANPYGVLVMAHGGSAQWNEAVEDSLARLRSLYPVEIAFGMADAESLEMAVRRLEAQQVKHVGVVRLFVSGESWYERTSQILGLIEGAPLKPAVHQAAAHGAMSMGFWKIETGIHFHLSEQGLAEAVEMDEVLLDRAWGMSANPASEVVVIIAHGPADDEENSRWISEIDERAQLLKQVLQLADVRVFTLREDWEEKREGAEQQIRDYIDRAEADGLTSIVIPFRVQGFGPYADVLQGLNYKADRLGLIPHANVALWIENQAAQLQALAEQHERQLAQLVTRRE